MDEFSLVSAFFLFSIGCLNILLGLIYRESAKTRRSVTAWRERYQDVLPTTAPLGPPRTLVMRSAWEKEGAEASRSGSLSSQKSGMGFGRQGEKAALGRGYTVTRPEEALPTYVPKRTVTVRDSTVSYAESETVA